MSNENNTGREEFLDRLAGSAEASLLAWLPDPYNQDRHKIPAAALARFADRVRGVEVDAEVVDVLVSEVAGALVRFGWLTGLGAEAVFEDTAGLVRAALGRRGWTEAGDGDVVRPRSED